MCFQSASSIALLSTMSWTIDFEGTNLNLFGVSPGTNPTKSDYGIIGPHVKVDFWNSSDSKQGSLLSLNVTPVPEPEIYAMMGLGLGLLGWVGRRRKLQAA